jgi:glutamate N-acetyltransferase/amino-acid N-acetyltransferase
MESKEILIEVDIGLGKKSATAWGCDLTYDYVKINAMYTT